jgi:endonuclease YncB( thermonuclease family)
LSKKTAQARPINLRPHKYTLRDVVLPDDMNLNQELVKQGWCWWYRRYVPGDTVLEGLKEGCARGEERVVGRLAAGAQVNIAEGMSPTR